MLVDGAIIGTAKGAVEGVDFVVNGVHCNEPRHVHVQHEDRLCKFWLEPVTLARNDGFSARKLTRSATRCR